MSRPLVQIKTMRVKALNAGIEMKLGALMLSRLRDEPVEQCATETAAVVVGSRHQIVHI